MLNLALSLVNKKNHFLLQYFYSLYDVHVSTISLSKDYKFDFMVPFVIIFLNSMTHQIFCHFETLNFAALWSSRVPCYVTKHRNASVFLHNVVQESSPDSCKSVRIVSYITLDCRQRFMCLLVYSVLSREGTVGSRDNYFRLRRPVRAICLHDLILVHKC